MDRPRRLDKRLRGFAKGGRTVALGDILGQIMQQGLGPQGGGQNPRLRNATESLQGGGGSLDAIFGQLQGALGRAGVDTAGLQQTAGGFADRAGDFLRKDQVGGLSGAQLGGIGAVAGALLGGGLGGAARGGAMAVLGTLALSALKNAQARRAGQSAPAEIEQAELEAVTAPENERLLLTAMISAAKADGTIDRNEMQKIIGKISDGSVTAEEKQFVLDEMAAPIDVDALAAQVQNRAQAAQVYAASLLAIDSDSEQEKAYLRRLAGALGLDDETVAQLHGMTGAAA
jgi:uncharacterized membrane protein YebE (DUF533 family)